MQPFFKYFGSKWKLARLYCRPRCEHVIEPFAGDAGYSVYWEPKKVTLIELNPVVHGVWKYLRRVSAREVMRLPSNITHVDELPPRVCQEAKWLIGFWFGEEVTKPAVCRSNWARTPILAARFWSETIKRRIASQVDHIRHWEIIEGSYEDAPDVKAHWHIDPPYDNAVGTATLRTASTENRWQNGAENASVGYRFAKTTAPRGYRLGRQSLLTTLRGRGYSVKSLYESSNWSPRRNPKPERRHRARGASSVRRRRRNALRNKRHSRRAS